MNKPFPVRSSVLMLLKMTGCAVIAHLAFLDPFVRPALAQEAAQYGFKIGRAACAYMEAGMSYSEAIKTATDDSFSAIWKSGINTGAVGAIAGAYMRENCKGTAIKRGADVGGPTSRPNCLNHIIVGSRKQCI